MTDTNLTDTKLTDTKLTDTKSYTFPFDTCEKPRKKGVAQPYSAFVNIVSALIILYFLFKTRTLHAFLLLLSLFIFDLVHTFSHLVHVSPGIQIGLVHAVAYIFNFTFLYALYKYSKKIPSALILLFMGVIVSCDVYAYFNLTLLYYLITQIILFFTIFIYYFKSLSDIMKTKLKWLLVIIGIIYLGFANEVYNGHKMLARFPNFPFHAIIEVFILSATFLVSSSFYKL